MLFSNSICSLHVSVTSGNPHNISKFFPKIIFVMVICDVTIVMVLGCHKPCSYKTANCVWTTPLTSHFPASLPLFGPPYSLRSEKAMASHSSTLAWKIPWMEEPVRLQSMGSLRVGHDWATSLSLFTFMHWRRKWQPTPVFLPGESQGWGSLVGCHLWGHTESETTEVT